MHPAAEGADATPNRLKFDTDEFYLKTAEEMRAVFRELPEACDATLADRRDVRAGLVYGSSAFGELHLPRFEPPDGHGRWTRTCASSSTQGAAERYGDV